MVSKYRVMMVVLDAQLSILTLIQLRLHSSFNDSYIMDWASCLGMQCRCL